MKKVKPNRNIWKGKSKKDKLLGLSALAITGKDIANEAKKTAQAFKPNFSSIGKDIRYAVWDSEGTTSRFKKGIANLLGFEWESLKGAKGFVTKMFIFFVLFCIFPAIPLFMVMGVLYKLSQFGFYYTRLL